MTHGLARKTIASTTPGCRVQLFASTPGAPVRWRLLGSNNREIGRGAESFADAETCRIAVKELQMVIDEFESAVRRTDRNDWVWQLRSDDRLVVVSAHGYDRQIRCAHGLAQFIDEMGQAGIGPGLMTSHARRWGGSIA
jgi:hypothetical protein